jgi:perosamine synthetase
MKTPLFHSIPPAGNKIPSLAILRSFKRRLSKSHETESLSLRRFLGDAHILHLSSGRAALWVILKAISALQAERKRVIIPAYTCPAVASAVLKAGLQPVLCDINLDNFGYSVDDLANVLDNDVLAVIAVHLFGFPTNIDVVTPLCREHDVFVVEDAAQAFGNDVPSSGNKLGLIGDVGFYSFGRGKPLSVLHGGLTATASEEIHEQCLRIYDTLYSQKNICTDLTYFASLFGYRLFSNPYLYRIVQSIPFLHLGETIFDPDFPVSKGSDIASGIVETLLEGLENNKKNRMKKTQWYNKNLPDTVTLTRLSSVGYPFLRYPLVMKDKIHRDALLKGLASVGISGALFYPCPLNELDGLWELLDDYRTYINAKSLSERLITLPVHEGVTEHDMIRIRSVIQHLQATQ